MMRIRFPLLVGFLALAIPAARGADDTQPADTPTADSKTADSNPEAETYTLRYRFHPGEMIRWEVLQQARVKATVSGTTQTTETVTKSVKLWRVTGVKPDGTATFEHSVESVDMWLKFSGRQEVRYNSLSDEEPPPGYESVAESIGVPLYVITMDAQGKILQRERRALKAAAENTGRITIPLPEEPVAVGHKWTFPDEISVPMNNGAVKRVKTLVSFVLKSAKTGVATIEVATRILTPIHDPAIEAKLIQLESSGTVRFAVDAGRVLGQQMDLDRRVVGFSGNASVLHYLTRFTEDLLPAEAKTASRPEPAKAETRE
jgi:hypothetical protein